MISTTLTVTADNGKIIESFENCAGSTVELAVGTYSYEYTVTVSGALASTTVSRPKLHSVLHLTNHFWFGRKCTSSTRRNQCKSFQALDLWRQGGSNFASIENPTYHTNPKSLDAKLTYAMFIPCLTFGAMVFVLLRYMGRGYEFEMNKCYGCDLFATMLVQFGCSMVEQTQHHLQFLEQ